MSLLFWKDLSPPSMHCFYLDSVSLTFKTHRPLTFLFSATCWDITLFWSHKSFSRLSNIPDLEQAYSGQNIQTLFSSNFFLQVFICCCFLAYHTLFRGFDLLWDLTPSQAFSLIFYLPVQAFLLHNSFQRLFKWTYLLLPCASKWQTVGLGHSFGAPQFALQTLPSWHGHSLHRGFIVFACRENFKTITVCWFHLTGICLSAGNMPATAASTSNISPQQLPKYINPGRLRFILQITPIQGGREGCWNFGAQVPAPLTLLHH